MVHNTGAHARLENGCKHTNSMHASIVELRTYIPMYHISIAIPYQYNNYEKIRVEYSWLFTARL